VHHEWGTLKEVIVGRGEDIIIPSWSDQIEKVEVPAQTKALIKKYAGKRLSEIDPETSQKIVSQFDGLAKLLENRGIIVHRPRLFTPDEINYLSYIQKGGGSLFPRDPVLVIGNNVIETALQGVFRRKEKFAIRSILLDAVKNSQAKYVSMPPASPRMPEDNDPDPFIEGGDVLLNGYEIYVGYSGRATNQAGIEWLKQYLGPQYQVHTIQLKPDVLHLDCAMALLRPGLGIICRDRIIGDLPNSLKNFDWVEVTEEEARRLATNALVLDKKTAIMDQQHQRIAAEVRKRGQEVLLIPFDAVSAWEGAFRCAHHPLRRD
ncbi:MAG: hypothetical protein KJ732_05310, partial [Candidatus Margulisbacteria bacterium]|nr:hypothetical protein [Candidatus Margulisiibacteriota bacterium]